MMEKLLRKINIRTHCLKCKKEVEEVWVCELDSVIGARYALICSICEKLIGIFSSLDHMEGINPNNIVNKQFQLIEKEI